MRIPKAIWVIDELPPKRFRAPDPPLSAIHVSQLPEGFNDAVFRRSVALKADVSRSCHPVSQVPRRRSTGFLSGTRFAGEIALVTGGALAPSSMIGGPG